MAKKLTFCFDICCPFAYIASQRMVRLGQVVGKNNVKVEWKPVLLGGLYDLTNAPQGKDGSATDSKAMPAENKRVLLGKDLRREAERWDVKLNWNRRHPIRTLNVQRLLCGVKDEATRTKMALEFYRRYWVADEDISDSKVIGDVAKSFGVEDVEKLVNAPGTKKDLETNTRWAVDHGAFGVPAFVCEDPEKETRLFFGQDRMFFVAQFFGVPPEHELAHPLRLLPMERSKEGSKMVKVTMYHDFSSPWSFLGSLSVHGFIEGRAEIEYKPILLGALFREIGTPNAPMLAMSPIKRAYGALDMNDWCKYHGNIQLKFPEGFPIRTVLPLRISIVEPKTIPIFYQTAWIKGLNLGLESVVRDTLTANGFNADDLITKANEQSVKDKLRDNTQEAQTLGACGVPTFQVHGPNYTSDLVWGQDRLNVVSDYIAEATPKTKL